MSLVTAVATVWSAPVTLTTDEIWQARKGSIFITTTETPVADDGIALHELHAIQFTAGVQVRYRKEGITEALIVREAV